jgi:hypothetical protein
MICFPQVSPPKSLCSSPLSVRATCLTHHIFLDLITRIILGWKYRSKKLLFAYPFPFPSYSSHLDQITFLRVLLSKAIRLCFYLNVGDPLSYPYRKEEREQSTNFNFYILTLQIGRQNILRQMTETILWLRSPLTFFNKTGKCSKHIEAYNKHIIKQYFVYYLLTHLLTYLLHCAESFLRS